MNRPTKNSTSADVARVAGVSKWTVIRAFTPGAVIAEETRARVLKAAGELNYRPNLLARSLATNRTHLVAILVDDFTNPYKLPTLDRLTAALQAEGMLGILVNINREYDHVAAIANAQQRQLDAVVLFGTSFRDSSIEGMSPGGGGPPMFVLARESTNPDIPSVTCDAVASIDQLCAHLDRRGYRRPAFLAGPRTISTALGRRRRFIEHYRTRSVPVVELAAPRYDGAVAAETVRRYLDETPPDRRCDVLMGENDILAIGALDVIRGERGLRVPGDMAVVGYDGIDLAGTALFDLTTYRQPYEAMVDVLVDMLVGRRPAETVRLAGELVVRGSG